MLPAAFPILPRGSTGDGYRFAQETGHRMVEPMPSLVPLKTKEEWGHELYGPFPEERNRHHEIRR